MFGPGKLSLVEYMLAGRQDTLHNDTQLNDFQPNDTQHISIQQNNKLNATLSIMTHSMTTLSKGTLSIMALDTKNCNAECHLCLVSRMLSVADKPFKLNVVMLGAIMLSVVTLSVVEPPEEPELTIVEDLLSVLL